MDLHSWIDSYLDHLRVERALAKNTLEAYSRDLGELAAHLGDVEDIRAIEASNMLDFIVAATRRGKSARSSARLLSGVRGFFRFLLKEKAIPTDPAELLERPKVSRRLPRVLSYEEIDRLLAASRPGSGLPHRSAARKQGIRAPGERSPRRSPTRPSCRDLPRRSEP